MQPEYNIRTNPTGPNEIFRETLENSTDFNEVYQAICGMNNFFHKLNTPEPPKTRSKYFIMTEPNPEHLAWATAQYIKTMATAMAGC